MHAQVAAAASARNAGGRSGSLSRKSSGANISDDSDEGGGVKGSLAARRATKVRQSPSSQYCEADVCMLILGHNEIAGLTRFVLD